MSNKRPKLRLLKNYAVTLERTESVHDSYDAEAEKLCAFLIDACPSGTMEEFARITGADMEKVFDAGNKAFRNRPK